LQLVFPKERFSSLEALGPFDVVVGSEAILALTVDGPSSPLPDNDLASYRLAPEATATIPLSTERVTLSAPQPGQRVLVVGFPMPSNGRDWVRIVSERCAFGDRVGDIPEYGRNQFDTNCPAWFGNSGGPALSFTPSGEAVLVGVVSHTFAFPSPDMPNAIEATGSDDFGPYVPSAVSAFASTVR
jgi:hypothetical protein